MTRIAEIFPTQMLVDAVSSDLAKFGYVLDGIEPVAGEFAAKATKTTAGGQQFSAQAMGRTFEDAAFQLVKTIARP